MTLRGDPEDLCQLSPIETICSDNKPAHHTFPLCYLALVSPDNKCPFCITAWGEDLAIGQTEKDCILYFIHKSSISSNILETVYQIYTWWYRIPAGLKDSVGQPLGGPVGLRPKAV